MAHRRTLEQNADNRLLEPFGPIGYVAEVNGPDAAEVPAFVPTRDELMQLAKYWAELELDLTYLMASTGTVGSDWLRKTSFAGRRLGRIERALGGDEVHEIVTRVREQFAATGDPEVWKLFCDGRHEELQRIVWERVEQGQAKRHLSRQGVPSGE